MESGTCRITLCLLKLEANNHRKVKHHKLGRIIQHPNSKQTKKKKNNQTYYFKKIDKYINFYKNTSEPKSIK